MLKNSYTVTNLLTKVVLAKYPNNNNQNFLKVKKVNSSSTLWKHIVDHRNFKKQVVHGF